MEQQINTVTPMTIDCNIILTQKDLTEYQWIMMGDYCPFDVLLKAKLGNNIPSVLKTSDDGTRLALAKSDLGLSFLEKEETLITQKNKTVQIIPSLDFSTRLHFVIAKNRENEPVIRALMQEIRILWNLKC